MGRGRARPEHAGGKGFKKRYVPATKEQPVESRTGVPLDVLVEETRLGTIGGLTIEDAESGNSVGGDDEIGSFEEIEVALGRRVVVQISRVPLRCCVLWKIL